MLGDVVEKLIREMKAATRSLLRTKGYGLTVIITLSACIAVNVAIFAIVNSVLLRPLPVPNAQQIVLMSNRYPKAGVPDQNISSSGDYYDRLKYVTALQDQAEFRFADQTLTINGMPQQAKGMIATPSIFPLLQVQPLLGRAFTETEGEIGSEQKVILSYGLWQELYAGDRNVLGRELRLSGRPFTIVGVMPRNFVFIDPEVRLWIPAAFTADEKATHHNNNWYSIGRLKGGATIQQVQAQVNAVNAANLDKFPQFKELLLNSGFHTAVEPLQDMLVRDVRGVMYLLWAGAVFVLLIGALNVANLALARVSLRKKEIATRLALGAGPARLMGQFLAENLVLAAISCALGLVLGSSVLRVLTVAGLNHFPRSYEVSIDRNVIAMTVLMAAGAGVLISVLSVFGFAKQGLQEVLRDDDRTGTGSKGTRRVRQSLVVAQIGFAFSLLFGAGLLLASFRQLLDVNPGFRTKGIVTASVSAPEAKYPDPIQQQALMNRALETIRGTPGVISAGATTAIPLGGDFNNSVILAEGHTMRAGESVISPTRLEVTPGYLETMGISLLRGRYFQEGDDRNSPLVVIVDERLAEQFWPHRDPVGQRMYEPDEKSVTKPDEHTVWYRVVGVVRSVRLEDLSGTGSPVGSYYYPYAQRPSNRYTIAIATAGDSTAMIGTVRAKMAALDPDLALFDVRTMAQREELSLASRRTSLLLAMAFGALALFLAAIGIYGVLAYLVAQRRREIGIRVALGSTHSGIVTLIVREGLVLVGIGLLLGLGGSASLRSVISTQIYGVRPLDPLVIATVTIVFAAVALCACIVPARRAMRVDPVRVLSEQ
jgi:putative ABC transport system permease protein